MAEPVRKNERGLSLLELLIALSILFIVFLGLLEAGLLVFDYNINNTLRNEGVAVTEMEMAELRNTPFAALPVGSTARPAVSRQVRGVTVNFSPTWNVTALNADNLQVVINVAWQRSAWTPSGRALRNYSHQVATIVRNR